MCPLHYYVSPTRSHVATQTILWASASRAGSPSPTSGQPRQPSLSHKIYSADGQLASF